MHALGDNHPLQMPSFYLHLQICAGTRKFKVAYSVPFLWPLVSQYSRVQLADKQQAMNHWMFSPTAYCWITLRSQLELSQQIYASDQWVMVHHCRHFCPCGCETIWSSTPLVCCFFCVDVELQIWMHSFFSCRSGFELLCFEHCNAVRRWGLHLFIMNVFWSEK